MAGKGEKKNEAPSQSPSTLTVTFGDRAENHAGMQCVGQPATSGVPVQRLLEIKKLCEDRYGFKCEWVDLQEYLGDPKHPLKTMAGSEAAVLVVRRALSGPDAHALEHELKALPWDRKAKMYGRVRNKNARWNLVFDDASQEPAYEDGKGRIIAWDHVPCLSHLREQLQKTLEQPLVAEGNYYYDISKCGIGWHGDTERRVVIGVRLGASMPLHFRWFYQRTAQGHDCAIPLHHGDVYIMSDNATGYNWNCSSLWTLRHAAGCDKYLKVPTPPAEKAKRKRSRDQHAAAAAAVGEAPQKRKKRSKS